MVVMMMMVMINGDDEEDGQTYRSYVHLMQHNDAIYLDSSPAIAASNHTYRF
jgi:hypothetical protein